MKKAIEGQINEDRSQYFLFETAGFDAYFKKNEYPKNMPFCVTDHWHDEVEFVLVKKGSIQYMVEGETMILEEGQGLFVNSRKIHVASADREIPCEFYIAILSPLLLCASRYIEQTYVEPVIQNDEIAYIRLENAEFQGAKAIAFLEQMYEAYQKDNKDYLTIQAIFLQLWGVIYSHESTVWTKKHKANHHMSTLKNMIDYIHHNYQNHLTLEEVSAAGNVGKTMCTKLFKTYVNRTPMEFLRDYRIQQSIVLLKTTDLSITDICYEIGFSGASYYGECFRKRVGMSPLEYRQEHRDIPLTHSSRYRTLRQDF